MNKRDAKDIVYKGVTVKYIKDILMDARSNTQTDWAKQSTINKSLSKGTVFNIMWRGFKDEEDSQEITSTGMSIAATNVLREFGETKRETRRVKANITVHHEEPIQP